MLSPKAPAKPACQSISRGYLNWFRWRSRRHRTTSSISPLRLHGKVGGAFTSTATQHGGQETTLFSIITNLLHFGMTVVGLNYGFAGQMKLDEVTGGSPYGATTITGGDGSRQPSANELAGARYQGRAIAETAKKLHG
jgi:NAD(P)H dehydrogenase (quinone)